MRVPGPMSRRLQRQASRYMGRCLNIGLYGLVLDSGSGCHIEDVDGNVYLDFLSGAAAAVLGYSEDSVVAEYARMGRKLQHSCYPYTPNKKAIELARRLSGFLGAGDKNSVLLGLTGSDSIDGAIKCARKYTRRSTIISFSKSYHGQTGLSHKASGLLGLEEHVTPRRGFTKVDFPETEEQEEVCLARIRELLHTQEVAAVIIEGIMGDGGCLTPPPAFYQRLQALLRRHGALMIADEIQMGLGRTGRWMSYEHYGVQPDLLVLGKSLGAGYVPVSAVVGVKEVVDSLQKADHLFTYSGHPPSCAAALRILETIKRRRLVSHARRMGKRLKQGLRKLQRRFPDYVHDVRGIGLAQGMELWRDGEPLAGLVGMRCAERGLCLGYYGQNNETLRFQPPLVIDSTQIDTCLRTLHTVLEEVHSGSIPESTYRGYEAYCLGLGSS